MIQMVEYLPSKHQALNSIPVITLPQKDTMMFTNCNTASKIIICESIVKCEAKLLFNEVPINQYDE
jgi:hypothetical protein